MNSLKKVLELIRVSTAEQAASDKASIPAQRTVDARTCHQYGLEIVRSIQVTDVSGASVLLAPEIQELMRLMKSPEIHGVVTCEFSRLIRPESFEDYVLLQAFVDSNTVLYLPEGPLDLSTKMGRLMGSMRAAIAGLERTEILERVSRAKEEKRRRGELAQSQIVLPFGVGYSKGQGFSYKPEAERVREAFRQVLAGNHTYSKLSKLVGVTPRGMHIILRNPIYTGWRVIDKKRDITAAGRYPAINGRQSDRRKVKRAPEEVIRVQVINEPLVSEADFQAVQQIMDRKQSGHWRCQENVERRFTYNGFVTCASCGEVIHTALARRDYYICKGRRIGHACQTKYMRREKLEAVLDSLFATRLTNPRFLELCVEELKQNAEKLGSARRIRKLNADVDALRSKRGRVVDTFVDGTIGREERDRRLTAIDHDIRVAEDVLMREAPIPALDSKKLVQSFAHLGEWEYWTRTQKRVVLSALVPDIRVADYRVESLGLNPGVFSYEDTRTGRGSWRRPA
jgi:DNA invertase Pin-like site-specific DNA recombinase